MMKKAKWLYDQFIYYPIFTASLLLMTTVARLKFHKATSFLAKFNAKTVIRSRKGRHKEELQKIGKEWARMFPNDMQRLISEDQDTVIYETHTWCPLRGTGDVDACYRVMEFDRDLHHTIGGQFIVLASQAEPGRKTCKVAIRKNGVSTEDLIHAHDRVKREKKKNEIPVAQINE